MKHYSELDYFTCFKGEARSQVFTVPVRLLFEQDWLLSMTQEAVLQSAPVMASWWPVCMVLLSLYGNISFPLAKSCPAGQWCACTSWILGATKTRGPCQTTGVKNKSTYSAHPSSAWLHLNLSLVQNSCLNISHRTFSAGSEVQQSACWLWKWLMLYKWKRAADMLKTLMTWGVKVIRHQ